MGKLWFGVVAGTFLIFGTYAAAQQTEELPSQEPQAEGDAAQPIEPILVQGYVKTVDEQQLTLTAPGAPVDLPLSLHEETRFIQGENDVERDSLQEGQLVRAALLPVGEDLVALVVELVPEEPAAEGPAAPGDEGLQGEEPPTHTEPMEPEPSMPAPSEPAPEPAAPDGGETKL